MESLTVFTYYARQPGYVWYKSNRLRRKFLGHSVCGRLHVRFAAKARPLSATYHFLCRDLNFVNGSMQNMGNPSGNIDVNWLPMEFPQYPQSNIPPEPLQ